MNDDVEIYLFTIKFIFFRTSEFVFLRSIPSQNCAARPLTPNIALATENSTFWKWFTDPTVKPIDLL